MKKWTSRGNGSVLIGTGSSGIQTIPVIAQEAGHLTVFQRTAQFSLPARNYPYDPEFIRQKKENFQEIRRQMIESSGGLPMNIPDRSALEDTPEERQKVYESLWKEGGAGLMASYNDLLTNEEANETAAEFVRYKICEIVTRS